MMITIDRSKSNGAAGATEALTARVPCAAGRPIPGLQLPKRGDRLPTAIFK